MDKINYIPNLENFYIENYEKANTKIKSYSANKLFPTKICPYLLHTLIPYIITLSNEGIFPWMIASDPNSVVVQCPKGDVSCRLTYKKDESNFSADIKSVNGSCLFHHFKDQKINLPGYKSHKENYLTFNTIFSWIVYGTLTKKNFRLTLKNPLVNNKNKNFYLRHGKSNFKNLDICSPKQEIMLKLSDCKRKICRYHKFSTCNNFKLETLCPPGLCPDLFYRAYTWCLMKLYENKLKIEKDKNPLIISCPNPKIGVELAVTKFPVKSVKLRVKIMDILRKFGKNADIPFYKISMKIINGSKDCPRGHCKGQNFYFNLGLGFERSLCPAAFNNIYPFLHSVLRGVNLPKPLRIQCPDDAVKNTYDLTWSDIK